MSDVALFFKKSLYIHRVGGGGVRRQENDAAVLRSIQVGGVVPSRMSTQVLRGRSLGASEGPCREFQELNAPKGAKGCRIGGSYGGTSLEVLSGVVPFSAKSVLT